VRGATADAARWNAYEVEMWGVGLEHYRRRLRQIGELSGLRVLDVGAGPGQWSLAAVREGAETVACDRRIGEALRRARRETPSARLDVVGADASRLPFASSRFDLILCMLVLPYVPVERTLAEFARVLKPGGLVFGVCHGPGYYLLQAIREAVPPRRNLIRRLLVLGYTASHRALRLGRYHYETFQTPGAFTDQLRGQGLEPVTITLGGHPTMPQRRVLGAPAFFEFIARRPFP
jgi:ubiquinone/menaquinone biosynthesis C-methylase UbiE